MRLDSIVLISLLTSPLAMSCADEPVPLRSVEQIHNEILKNFPSRSHKSLNGANIEYPPSSDLSAGIRSVEDSCLTILAGEDDWLRPGHRLLVKREGREIAIVGIVETSRETALATVLLQIEGWPRAGDIVTPAHARDKYSSSAGARCQCDQPPMFRRYRKCWGFDARRSP